MDTGVGRTVKVVSVGGVWVVHPVFLHEDVKVENSEARRLVEAMGIASCVESNDK